MTSSQDVRSVIVTGASGLIGRAATETIGGTAMPRREVDGLWWEPEAERVHDDGRRVDAVVHLAGENASEGRWTARKKRAIWTSRERGTRGLVRWMCERAQRPRVLVSASGIGFYGERGEAVLGEDAGPGRGYLPEASIMWEELAERATAAGIRVVRLRIGAVLSRQGGMLARMLPLFRVGLGGPFGSGMHWLPWVHLADVVGAIEWAIREPEARGAYNVVAPGIVRQGEFTAELARQIRRPALVPVPAFALRVAYGELADELILASTRVVPRRLQAHGYVFRFPELRAALESLLARDAS